MSSTLASSTSPDLARLHRGQSAPQSRYPAPVACCRAIPPSWLCHRRSAYAPETVSQRRNTVVPLPATPAAATGTEAGADAVYTTPSGLTVTLRAIRTLDELRQVATLRADAYYADNHSRFVGSLKKKFVEQEMDSLQQRTNATSRTGQPFAECLVAVDTGSGAVLGCIDLRLPKALNGSHPQGVPEDDPHGCYLLNVVVREDARAQGLGRGIMRHAMGRAVGRWGARQLYTHVEADNEVAYRLYRGCGFDEHSVDSKYEAASKLGQTVLLRAPASAAEAA